MRTREKLMCISLDILVISLLQTCILIQKVFNVKPMNYISFAQDSCKSGCLISQAVAVIKIHLKFEVAT